MIYLAKATMLANVLVTRDQISAVTDPCEILWLQKVATEHAPNWKLPVTLVVRSAVVVRTAFPRLEGALSTQLNNLPKLKLLTTSTSMDGSKPILSPRPRQSEQQTIVASGVTGSLVIEVLERTAMLDYK
ncbi:hypothetical protein [Luteimonas notoginsengisoli]|uniref:Uncharacterized protein n=1 Tax=Luteimonas notoginsengisoli TaxID=1578200 RepID=A0ABV7UU58_9GAMM